jgi:hypothetical protein
LFLENKYSRWYFAIVSKADKENRQKQVGYELHHILPKTLFPQFKNLQKNRWNGVFLTYREHFICHWLLPKIVSDKEDIRKMMFGLSSMKRGNHRIISSWQYEIIKKALVLARTGKRHSIETRKKIADKGKGRKISDSHRAALLKANLGRKLSQEVKDRISRIRTGTKRTKETCEKISRVQIGRRHSEETKLKISIASKDRKLSLEARKKVSDWNKERTTIYDNQVGKAFKILKSDLEFYLKDQRYNFGYKPRLIPLA